MASLVTPESCQEALSLHVLFGPVDAQKAHASCLSSPHDLAQLFERTVSSIEIQVLAVPNTMYLLSTTNLTDRQDSFDKLS